MALKAAQDLNAAADGGAAVKTAARPGLAVVAGDGDPPTWTLDLYGRTQTGQRRRRDQRGEMVTTPGRLPLGRGSIGAVDSGRALWSIPAEQVPLGLAHLHDAMVVGAQLDLSLRIDQVAGIAGRPSRGSRRDDPRPGQGPVEAIEALLAGGGFSVLRLAKRRDSVEIRASRLLTLPDFVAPNLRILVCGLNPSLYSAEAGYGFARGTNRFWRAASEAGLVTGVRKPLLCLENDRVGMTDLVKRPTVRSSELSRAEYRVGAARVRRLVDWLRPGLVLFVGLEGWRAAVDPGATPGLQLEPFAAAAAYVMPSTSGLNARTGTAELVGHMRTALEAATTRSPPASL